MGACTSLAAKSLAVSSVRRKTVLLPQLLCIPSMVANLSGLHHANISNVGCDRRMWVPVPAQLIRSHRRVGYPHQEPLLPRHALDIQHVGSEVHRRSAYRGIVSEPTSAALQHGMQPMSRCCRWRVAFTGQSAPCPASRSHATTTARDACNGKMRLITVRRLLWPVTRRGRVSAHAMCILSSISGQAGEIDRLESTG